MRELIIKNTLVKLGIVDKIEKMEDKSSNGMSRVRMWFKNGHELSIIRGEYSYGGDRGLFEIMTSPELVEGYQAESGLCDNPVDGYLTVEAVEKYIIKVANAEKE